MKHILIIILYLLVSDALALPSFKFFGTSSEADQFYVKNYEPLYAGIEAREEYQLIERSNNSYKRVEEIVSLVHESFIELYNDQIQYSTPPIVLIIDSEEMNAFAPGSLGKEKTPYFFVVHSGLFALNDNEMTAIIAHELAHLHLQWVEEGERYPKYKYYEKRSHLDYGNTIKSSAELKSLIRKREELRTYAGPFSNDSLQGVPLHYDNNAITGMREVRYLLENAPNNKVCNDARSFNDMYISEVINNHFSYSDLSFNIDSDITKNEINKYSQALELLLKNCLTGVRFSYLELVNKVYNVPMELLSDLVNGFDTIEQKYYDEISSYYEQYDAIDAILLYTRKYRQSVLELEEKVSVNNIRIYTHEDHADEIAVEVLKNMELSSDYLSDFLIRAFSDDEIETNCDYRTDVEPNYGPLENDHHLSCWRAYRNYNFEKTL